MVHIWVAWLLLAGVARATGPKGTRRLPDAQRDGIIAVKQWARLRLREADDSWETWSSASDFKLPRQPSPTDWAQALVYGVQVDRFNNGNSSNDALNIGQRELQQRERGELQKIPYWRHGGDLRGIRQRLEYIRDIGFNTIWLSPLAFGNGEYDNHCTMDPSRLDPNFGSQEELRELVREAHLLGMLVVLDVNVGYLCDPETKYTRPALHSHCTAEHSNRHQYWNGDEVLPEFPEQGELSFSDTFFKPLRHQSFFFRCGSSTKKELRGGTSEATGAAMFGDPEHGAFRFDTRNRDLQEIFTDLQKWWIAYTDLDGIRLSRVEHITEDFLAYFSSELRDYAQFLGKRDFQIIGEVNHHPRSSAGILGHMNVGFWTPQTLKHRLGDIKNRYKYNQDFKMPGLSSVTNLEQSSFLRGVVLADVQPAWLPTFFGNFWIGWPNYNVVMKQLLKESEKLHLSWSNWNNWLVKDTPQDCASVTGSQLWTYLEGEGWPRLLHKEEKVTGRSTLAFTLLYTLPGVPVIMYGQEQGFNGNCPEIIDVQDEEQKAALIAICEAGVGPAAHQDFFAGPWRLGSTQQMLNALGYVGLDQARPPPPPPSGPMPPIRSDPFLRQGHATMLHLQRMLALRQTCPTLSLGRVKFHRSAVLLRGGGPIVYSRVLYDEDPTMAEKAKRPSGSEMVVIVGVWDKNPSEIGLIQLDPEIHKHAKTWDKTQKVFRNVFDPDRKAIMIGEEIGRPMLDLTGQKVVPGEVLVFVHDSRYGEFDPILHVARCKPNVQPLVAGDFEDRCGAPARQPLMSAAAACVLVAVVLWKCSTSSIMPLLSPKWRRFHFSASFMLIAGPVIVAIGLGVFTLPSFLFPAGVAFTLLGLVVLPMGALLTVVALCCGRVTPLMAPRLELRDQERRRRVLRERSARRQDEGAGVELQGEAAARRVVRNPSAGRQVRFGGPSSSSSSTGHGVN